MSEYQYYEFQAIDRPLGERESRALRALSIRARITSTSFVNTYEWGDFKGDPGELMEKCFDAFLHLTNWGTRELMLRVPRRLLDSKTASLYAAGDHFAIRVKDENAILAFFSDDESGGDWVDGDGWLSSLVPLRADLIRGDLRALYLGWLLGIQAGKLEDDAIEPPVPPGLDELTGSLKSFAEFLRIDENLIEAAARLSPRLGALGNDKELKAWVCALPEAEKNALLFGLIGKEDRHLGAELLRRFSRARAVSNSARANVPPVPKGRTVSELRSTAERLTQERRRKAQELEARERVLREREQAEARAKYLDRLAQRESAVWREVEILAGTFRPRDYDQAVKLLVDLRDLSSMQGCAAEFQKRFEQLRAVCAKKTSLLRRMEKAGLRITALGQ